MLYIYIYMLYIYKGVTGLFMIRAKLVEGMFMVD